MCGYKSIHMVSDKPENMLGDTGALQGVGPKTGLRTGLMTGLCTDVLMFGLSFD